MYWRLFRRMLVAVTLVLSTGLPGWAAPPANSLYPIAVGSKWTYEAGPLQVVEEVTRFEMVDGERCARVETSVNGKVIAYEHLAERADGVYRVTVAGERVTPPLCFLRYPARIDANWQVSSFVNGVEISGEFSAGRGQVVVPAGEFDAYTVHGTKFESAAGPLEFTYYFVPGIGKVKQVISTKDKSAELALTKFQLAR